ncbi:MAG: Nif3-like dinuclear metal center hexameric protein [Lentimicrobiaceae bacterium]|nr:Nif3-like dinuclear metal center hexameric protein [Lentimicrobiaceae bacterium]
MKLKEIIQLLESKSPLDYQESFDNSGLQIGDVNQEINGALICFDVTNQIVEQCISKNFNLIISHHPLFFKGIKQINQQSNEGKMISRLIKHDIAVYSMHTSIDNQIYGVNGLLAQLLGVKPESVLQPVEDSLLKLSVFCPESHAAKVREAIFESGAGYIGNYDSCSFNTQGIGTYRANENANPFAGEINKLHSENEVKIEVILPKHLKNAVVANMIKHHPYEEVAYDLYPIVNVNSQIGSGVIGKLPKPIKLFDFFDIIKTKLNLKIIRHNSETNHLVQRIAMCGGSGAFLIPQAMRLKADVFLSGDIKYHDFFTDNDKLIVADIGHFESEQFITNWIFNLIKEKFHNFATEITSINSNPVKYH